MKEFIEIPACKQSLGQRKLVYGVGVNDADYMTQPLVNGKLVRCPYYTVWISMLRRAYGSKFHINQPTYVGCSVCTEWLTFSNFKGWMLMQDFVEKALDKDLLVVGNKIYSPDTCLFISKVINNLITDHTVKTGIHALGVSRYGREKSYRAIGSIDGRRKPLGSFPTEAEASRAYRTFKASYIKQVALEQTNQQLKEALLRHAALYLEETNYERH
jgi:hypothetical protein